MLVIGPMPERPSTTADQNAAFVLPIGDTTPIPVMTTRCIRGPSYRLRRDQLLHDVGDVGDGGEFDLLRAIRARHSDAGALVRLERHGDVEFFFQGEDDLDDVERFRAQFVKTRFGL